MCMVLQAQAQPMAQTQLSDWHWHWHWHLMDMALVSKGRVRKIWQKIISMTVNLQ